MTTFPNSPRILKGGLVLIDPESARVLRIIALQYNPESLSRSLQIQSAGGEGGNSKSWGQTRLKSWPTILKECLQKLELTR
jgi:hypothetical protein